MRRPFPHRDNQPTILRCETRVPALFEDQIGRPIVIDELANISGLLAERPKAADVLIIAVDRVAGRHANAGQLVTVSASPHGSVNVHVHHICFGRRVVEDLRPLQDPAGPEVFRVGLLEHIFAKGPMRQIAGRITRDVALGPIESLARCSPNQKYVSPSWITPPPCA